MIKCWSINSKVLLKSYVFKQYYKFLGKDINMVSLIKLQIRDGKVVRHEDWYELIDKPLEHDCFLLLHCVTCWLA